MKTYKKVAALALSAVFVISMAGIFTACGGEDDPTSFTVWIPEGENSSMYDDYAENPVVKYLESKTWEGDTGDEVNLSFEWQIPASGAQNEAMATAVASDNLADVVDASFITNVMPILELYEEGYILDLTDYVEKYMPNYMAYLEENPDLAKTATNTLEDGTKAYLQIYAYQGEEWMWGGWMYRRDWIVKYGTNPSTGASFSGGYTDEDNTEWEDDVYFPSWYDDTTREWYLTNVDEEWDGQDPVTIADWEWMLRIFVEALDQQGIKDGYAMQLYYPGYYETGDLITSFGGGGGTWYADEDLTTAYFGLTGDGFRTYLECMNDWYEEGLIDQSFNENTTLFYETDSARIALGEVGLWYGMQSQCINSLDSGEDDYTSGICVLGARQPINTTYGDSSVQYAIPSVMYQTEREMRSFVVTDKAEDKDLAALFTMMDYMYSDEGNVLSCFGLSAEQYAEYKETTGETIEIMERYVDENGAIWTYTEENGYKYNDNISSTAIEDALRGSKLWGKAHRTEYMDKSTYTDTMIRAYDEWVFYRLKGGLSESLLSQMDPDDYSTYTTIKTNLRSWAEANIYLYVKNSTSAYDVTDDSVWAGLCKNMTNRKVNTVTEILQELLDSMNES